MVQWLLLLLLLWLDIAEVVSRLEHCPQYKQLVSDFCFGLHAHRLDNYGTSMST